MCLQWQRREFIVHKLLCTKLELHLFFSCLYQALGISEPDGGCHCTVKYYSLLLIITLIPSITPLKQSCICKMCSRETSAIPLLGKVLEDCSWLAAGSCSSGYALIFYRPCRKSSYYWIKNKGFCHNTGNRREGTSLTDNSSPAISWILAYWQCYHTKSSLETLNISWLWNWNSYMVSPNPSCYKVNSTLPSMYHELSINQSFHGFASSK